MSKETELDAAYWSNRYEEGRTGWDIGYPSPAIIEYAEARIPKTANILMPGAGNGHEAMWLYKQGWTNVNVLDFAQIPLEKLQKTLPEFPEQQLIHNNFFEHQGSYDFILEQTFFCALTPNLRPDYVNQMRALLNPEGRLAGLFFNHALTEKGPPFGGSIEEYRTHFGPYFEILKIEDARNSIKPREGSEWFFEFKIKDKKR